MSSSSRAGARRRAFRVHGAAEYTVVAKRIARILSRKSVTSAAGVYGEKKERRDWRTDQRRIAA